MIRLEQFIYRLIQNIIELVLCKNKHVEPTCAKEGWNLDSKNLQDHTQIPDITNQRQHEEVKIKIFINNIKIYW